MSFKLMISMSVVNSREEVVHHTGKPIVIPMKPITFEFGSYVLAGRAYSALHCIKNAIEALKGLK